MKIGPFLNATKIAATITQLAALGVLLLSVGCSSSPTAPTPPAPVINNVPTVTPPVATVPPVVTPDPLLSDPRFSLSFYRAFARNGYEQPNALQPLRRQTHAPSIYLRTVFDDGRPVDPVTLDRTAAALINTTGKLTGVFGLAGLEKGTSHRLGQSGWITVEWLVATDTGACGRGAVGGDFVRLYPNASGCRCPGSASIINMAIVKHELGHALGYWHTDSRNDLMGASGSAVCDMEPSDREVLHARIAYSQPIGSLDPK